MPHDPFPVPAGARRSSAADAPSEPLPGHYAVARSQYVFSVLSIAGALLALGTLALRIAKDVDVWHWWVPLAFAGGIAAADFASGLIHWGADTWGSDDLPVIGHRLLVPFRVHHVNPDDFLRRSFVDTNGDVFFVVTPVLLGLLVVPIEWPGAGPALVFGAGLCGVGMMTNQIHQWAHMPDPPRLVRVLQACGLILGPAEHASHHERPYDCHYCITTGWCNRPAEAIMFFRRVESLMTRLTGARPRHDDRRYEERFGVPAASAVAPRG